MKRQTTIMLDWFSRRGLGEIAKKTPLEDLPWLAEFAANNPRLGEISKTSEDPLAAMKEFAGEQKLPDGQRVRFTAEGGFRGFRAEDN